MLACMLAQAAELMVLHKPKGAPNMLKAEYLLIRAIPYDDCSLLAA